METMIFDIETGPLPKDVILHRVGAFPDFVDKPFDPGSVKFGNIKDPVKMRAKVDEARARHELGRDEWKIAKEEYERAAIDKAALSPVTGRVVAIGMMAVDGLDSDGGEAWKCGVLGIGDVTLGPAIPAMTEHGLLDWWWTEYQDYDRIIGHNIFGFDLPFLIRRSWMLGVDVPVNVLDKDRYWNPVFVDTMTRWSCGSRDYVSLDTLAKIVGHDGKNGSGADFARLWFGTPEERQQAKEYLENDLEMTFRVAEMMGLV